MPGSLSTNPSLTRAFLEWWQGQVRRRGAREAARTLLSELRDFVVDSTPERRRQRYGDAGYDWDYRVDTTSATVSFRDRLLGVFHHAYQPTEPGPFHEMIAELPIDHRDFIFIDLGCGKGRTLLMASDYAFQKIVGVELLPTLVEIARANITKYAGEREPQCPTIEVIQDDARNYSFPAQPIIVYLFHPFPEPVLEAVLANLDDSVRRQPRPAYVIYHNPVLEHVLQGQRNWRRISRTEHWAIYRDRP